MPTSHSVALRVLFLLAALPQAARRSTEMVPAPAIHRAAPSFCGNPQACRHSSCRCADDRLPPARRPKLRRPGPEAVRECHCTSYSCPSSSRAPARDFIQILLTLSAAFHTRGRAKTWWLIHSTSTHLQSDDNPSAGTYA